MEITKRTVQSIDFNLNMKNKKIVFEGF